MCKHVYGLMGNHLARVSVGLAHGNGGKLCMRPSVKVKPMPINEKDASDLLCDICSNRTMQADEDFNQLSFLAHLIHRRF